MKDGATHTKMVALSPENLALAGASRALLLDFDAFGRGVTLAPPVANQVHRVAIQSEVAASSGKPATVRLGVAVIHVHGPLAQREIVDMCAHVDGYDAVTARFKAAIESEADAVVLVIDSPGGDAAGIEQATTRMQAMKAATKKPVVVFADELMASGGYWLAATLADEIVIPPAGRVGSIGCISNIADFTKALENEGVKIELIRVPEGKAENHPYQPITDLARERATRECTAIAERFFAVVSAARGIKVDKVRAFNADVFRGEDAISNKLADRIGTFEDALQRAATLARKSRAASPKAKIMSIDSANSTSELGELLSVTNPDTDTMKQLCGIVGATSNTDLIAKVTGLKETSEALVKAQAEIVQLKADKAALSKENDDTKLEAAIKAGEADFRVRPENVDKVRAFYAKHGLEGAVSYIDALPPLPSASVVKEPSKSPDETPSSIAASLPAVAEKSVKTMTNMERHEFVQKHGAEAFRAAMQAAQ